MRTPADQLLIGAHTSIAGGVANALLEGEEIGATTVQIFTSNQKQWYGRKPTIEALEAWEKAVDKTGLSVVMSHDSYLINLGSPDKTVLAKSRKAFAEELERCHLLKLKFLNFHPGAMTTSSEAACLETIIDSLLEIEKLAHQGATRLLIETTAGQGTAVGHRFEHLAQIIDGVKKHVPIGVCIDTCHIFAAGYDIRTVEGWQAVLKAFDTIVGLDYLYALHVNDSLHPLGSRKDRHANLGHGKIGSEGFRAMMQNPHLRDLPKYLETPNGDTFWKREIALLRKYAA